MNRIIASASLLFLVLMQSACSYSVTFALVNESDKTIEVEYAVLAKNIFTAPSQTDSLAPSLAPARVPILVWERDVTQEDWIPVPSEQYTYDPKTGTVRFRIAPHEAVRILTAGGDMFFRDGYRDFPITRLEMKGETGKMTFEGAPQLFKQFQEKSSGNYFIAYKALPKAED